MLPKGHVAYWQIDQLKQNEGWDEQEKFQLRVVIPYCIKTGRRLKSADEIEVLTNGRLRIEEHLMLQEAYDALIREEKCQILIEEF